MPALTAKGAATRQRIVDAAAGRVRSHGVVGTSLDDVMKATDTSKSQLFHYFPNGKAELLLAVAQHEADRVLSDQQPYLSELDSVETWQSWRDLVVRRYREQGQQCPLSALQSELGVNDPSVRAVVTELLATWQDRIVAGIRTMQAGGNFDAKVDADRAGAALLAGLQGGVTMLLATGSIMHLEAALDLGIAQLLSVGGKPRRARR
jgi:AcrR family transcriptional regulator